MQPTGPHTRTLAVLSKNRLTNSTLQAPEVTSSTSRRRHQRGSLTLDGDRWIARWREDVRIVGGEVKRARKKEVLGTLVEYPTKSLAERALAKRLGPVNNEDYKPTSTITFAQFAETWMAEIMIHDKESSQSSQKSVVRAQLLPFFGRYEIRRIDPELIQQFVNRSEKSPKTIKNAISVLMVMWDVATAWGYAQHNPFPRRTNGRLLLKLPQPQPSRPYCFTVDETRAIIDRATGRWKTFFRILAETGMRPGEVAGLKRDAVRDGTLTVSQSIWGQKVQTPKTRTAIRTFAIGPELAGDIQQLIAESEPNAYGLIFVTDQTRLRKNQDLAQPPSWVDIKAVRRMREKGLTFKTIADRLGYSPSSCLRAASAGDITHRKVNQNEGGKPLSMDNFRNRVLNPILDELGISDKIKALGVRGGNYAFRHMNATLMDGINAPLKIRMKRLGHAQIETTMRYYTHAIDTDDRRVADEISALLSGGRSEVKE